MLDIVRRVFPSSQGEVIDAVEMIDLPTIKHNVHPHIPLDFLGKSFVPGCELTLHHWLVQYNAHAKSLRSPLILAFRCSWRVLKRGIMGVCCDRIEWDDEQIPVSSSR